MNSRDCWSVVFTFLNAQDLLSLLRVNKYVKRISQTDAVWKYQLHDDCMIQTCNGKDVFSTEETHHCKSMKELYMKHFLLRKQSIITSEDVLFVAGYPMPIFSSSKTGNHLRHSIPTNKDFMHSFQSASDSVKLFIYMGDALDYSLHFFYIKKIYGKRIIYERAPIFMVKVRSQKLVSPNIQFFRTHLDFNQMVREELSAERKRKLGRNFCLPYFKTEKTNLSILKVNFNHRFFQIPVEKPDDEEMSAGHCSCVI